MSCFNTVSTVNAAGDLDLTKHVNFTSGMILGVDDFTQEFGYLSGRDRWLARDLIGYGTVTGLKVTIDKVGGGADGWRVMVEPGVAITPRGQFVCVSAAQCAILNQWLAANADKLSDWIEGGVTSPPVSPSAGDEIRLFVTLCYRECLTDSVAIPGEPCRSEAELRAASRVKDDFSLELRFEPPNQPEENKIREFVAWLKSIEISEIGAPTTLEDFIEIIRSTWLTKTSPPEAQVSPPFLSPDVLRIHPDDVDEFMKEAFRLWVTELRHVLSERKTGCGNEMTGGNKMEDCVLLAELKIPLEKSSPGWKVDEGENYEIIEDDRPILLHLRMLQELLGFSFSKTYSLDDLSDISVPAPNEGDLLVYHNGEWVARQINIPQPQSKQFLHLPLATITRVEQIDGDNVNFFYEIWFNIGAPNNLAEIKELKPDTHLRVFDETNSARPAPPFKNEIEIAIDPTRIKNVFNLKIGRDEPDRMRFEFNIKEIQVTVFRGDTGPLIEYAEKNDIKFMGYLEGEIATIFVRGLGKES